jgi:hypothetical protein
MDRTVGTVNNHSSPAAKIALFRSLFRGREEIYPRRFESRKTGKSGYQPALSRQSTLKSSSQHGEVTGRKRIFVQLIHLPQATFPNSSLG